LIEINMWIFGDTIDNIALSFQWVKRLSNWLTNWKSNLWLVGTSHSKL